MRFMILVKATADTENEKHGMVPDQKMLADMASYHEELAKAGVEAEIEVRQLYELDELGHPEQTRRLRDLGMG
jgi:hypothetical protein